LEPASISYFIWTGNPEIFSVGALSVKWNVVLLVLGYLICRQLLLYIYASEKKPLNEVAALSIYLVIVAVLGARLVHVLIDSSGSLWTNFPSVLLPFEFTPDFHVLEREEFSVHGAIIAILIFLWLYGKKKMHDYFQRADRFSIASVLLAVFILIGSFFNSELIGKRTDSFVGTVFIRPVLSGIVRIPCCIMRSPDGNNPLGNVAVKKDPSSRKREKTTHKSIILYLFFKEGASEQLVNEFLVGDVKAYLYDMAEFVYEPGTEPLSYKIFQEKDKYFSARIKTKGISRYPVQVFEAIGCALLFIALFSFWKGHKIHTPPGRLFGCFMVVYWGLHLALGFLKEKQLPLDFAFDILFVFAGISVLAFSFRKNSVI
jgi:phosphatidylglycerol---prolipoprotein diacylglyceryl transferase